MKRTKKNLATARIVLESNKRKLKRLLREMAWNDWSAPLAVGSGHEILATRSK
jgi:hypothetical protein